MFIYLFEADNSLKNSQKNTETWNELEAYLMFQQEDSSTKHVNIYAVSSCCRGFYSKNYALQSKFEKLRLAESAVKSKTKKFDSVKAIELSYDIL